MRILIIEDEMALAEAIAQLLKKNNYITDLIFEGQTGLDYALSNIYDLIILDIMLPNLDGLTLLSALRQEKIMTPVLLLTAKDGIEDKVKGLDYGADDYLSKPFAIEELMARIRALLRRKDVLISSHQLSYGDILLDQQQLLLIKAPTQIKLTLKEANLLELLIHQKGIITSKEYIIEKLWGFDSDAEHNNVEVYISFLRKKLSYLNSSCTIKTTRSLGYSLEANTHV
jgi:DNA-binding response OmpR family regulator